MSNEQIGKITATNNSLETGYVFVEAQQSIQGPPPEWNPTTLDVTDPENEYIAQKIFGMIPCDGWHYMNFGSAGGAALMAHCGHKQGECYSTVTTGNMHGKIGGCPEYNKNWGWAKELVAHWRKLGLDVGLTFTVNGVRATIRLTAGATLFSLPRRWNKPFLMCPLIITSECNLDSRE
jgi:hypothetical protein